MTEEINDSASRALHFDMDFDVEKAGVCTLFAERLIQSGNARPMAVFFRFRERVCSVTCRPTESEEDFIRAMHHIMHLQPTLHTTSILLAMSTTVKLLDETFMDAVVVIGVSAHGSMAEAFPYRLEDGGVVWDTDSKIDTSSGLYSKVIDHMFPTFMMVTRDIIKPTEVINFLSCNGFDVELHGDYDYTNIDAKTHSMN